MEHSESAGRAEALVRVRGALVREVTGSVLSPGDSVYDSMSSGFDLSVVHAAPILVAPSNTADVIAAVGIAAAHEVPITVIGGGHADVPPVTDGVLLTTRRLDFVALDAHSRTATVGSGATWSSVMDVATPVGLAPLGGSAPEVGVGGYLSGGGIGPLARTFGFSTDHVRGFEVVTADGTLRRASAEEHPDLFWALRGGKGGFGVVTSATIELLDLPTIYGGGEYYSSDDIPGLLRSYQDFVSSQPVPEQLTTSIAILRLPDIPALPFPLRGRTVGNLRIGFVGTAADAEKTLAPLRAAIGAPVFGATREMPYGDIGTIHNDPTVPSSHATAGMLLDTLSPATIEAILRVAGPDVAAPLAIVELRHLGGALARGSEADAITGRGAAFGLWVSSAPMPGRVQESALVESAAGVRGVLDAVAEWSLGRVQINFCGSANTFKEASSAWSAEILEGLAAVRRTYDPHRRFPFTPGSKRPNDG